MSERTASSTAGSSMCRRSVPTLITQVRSPSRRMVGATRGVAVSGSVTWALMKMMNAQVDGAPNLHCSTLRRVRAGAVLIAVAAALAAAAPASAADVSLKLGDAAGVRLGNATELAGRVTAAGAPLTGRTVRLEVRAHPFDGG